MGSVRVAILGPVDTLTGQRQPHSSLRFSLLASGSSGNAALVVSPGAKVLVDAGLAFKTLCGRADSVGEGTDDIDAVFITHEHIDHVQCLGTLSRKLGVPAYMTEATYRNLPQKVGALPKVEIIEAGDKVTLGDMEVTSFSVSHDAADPVSYSIQSNGAKLGFATDLGHCCSLVRARLAGSNALVVESNYCPERLRLGIYPARIQQRIRGRQGHLSNQDASSLVRSLLHSALRTVVLVHISENNNSPDLVRQMAEGALRGHAADLYIAQRDEPTPFFEVAQ